MNNSRRFGEWLREKFHISGENIEQLLATQKHHPVFLGTLAIESGLIDPDKLAYHLNQDPDVPDYPEPFIINFDDITSITRWYMPDAFIKEGYLVLGRREQEVVVACLRWPPETIRLLFQNLFDQPVQFLLVSRSHWCELVQQMNPNFFTQHIPGVDLQPFIPPTIPNSLEPDHPWSTIILECIRRKRTSFTLNQLESEAWLDFHTPQVPLKPFDTELFSVYKETLKCIFSWHQPAWLSPHQGFAILPVGRRTLHILTELHENPRQSWIHARLIEPQRNLSSAFNSRDLQKLFNLWGKWVETSSGSWIISFQSSPFLFSTLAHLLRTFCARYGLRLIGVDSRFGMWPEFDAIVPYPALQDVLEQESDKPVALFARWDWDGETLQDLFLLSTRFPLFLFIESPTFYHAVTALWRYGFDSLFHAGRIHGWLNFVEARKNCDWCSESRHPPASIELRLANPPIQIDTGETWRQSLICDACKDLQSWQNAMLHYEWGLIPGSEVRHVRHLKEFFHIVSHRTPRPIWVPILKDVRQGYLDGRWVSGFLMSLSALDQTSESKQ